MAVSAASTRRTERRACRWIFPEPDKVRAAALARSLTLPEPIGQILCLRGISDPDSARAFLDPTLSALHDPMLLRDLDRALDRLRLAIARGEAIEIHGDYDVDGTTSTVLLKTAIEMAGGKAGYFIPHRIKDGYGLRESALERAAAAGVRLIISVDTGIRAAAAVERARALGMDVIVTDHHLPESGLPAACAVVNPNRPDCGYPEKNLCGAAVAFKLAQALLSTLAWPRERLDRVLASLLKLVAIATIADVVPLTGENRIIVAHGLRGLADVRNPGLRALLQSAGVADGSPPTTRQVGFAIAPRINAAGRMEDASEIVELFLTTDAQRAHDIAERLSLLNSRRQNEEAHIIEEIISECETLSEGVSASALVFARDGWHRGVLGIVASRLAERFCRPVFVLGIAGDEAAGSGRSIPAFHLLESLESMHALFVKFGGHKQAAGVTLDAARIEDFRSRFADYAASRLMADDFQPVQRIDATIGFRDLDDSLWQGLSRLQPFGMGNPCPVFVARDVAVSGEFALVKERHVRFTATQDDLRLDCKAFDFAHRADEFRPGARLDIAFRIESDDYKASGWSAHVCDVRPAITPAS